MSGARFKGDGDKDGKDRDSGRDGGSDPYSNSNSNSDPVSLFALFAPADFFSTTAGRTLARAALALILLAMWQYLPGPDLRFWMSGPLEIVARLCSWIADGSLWENVGATLLAMTLG